MKLDINYLMAIISIIAIIAICNSYYLIGKLIAAVIILPFVVITVLLDLDIVKK